MATVDRIISPPLSEGAGKPDSAVSSEEPMVGAVEEPTTVT